MLQAIAGPLGADVPGGALGLVENCGRIVTPGKIALTQFC